MQVDTTILAPAVPSPGGLSESEVAARRARGQGNDAQLHTGRSYGQILRQNTFTFINIVLFTICLALLVMGRFDDVLVTAGVALVNVFVGMAQEVRAKRHLDQIALLTRPRVTAIREGQEKTIDPAEIVVDDVLVLRPGDQVVVDGQVVGDGHMDMDESLLTGESNHVPKVAGDTVYSGSFCVSGSGRYVAQRVGAESLANRITAGARAFRLVKTALQRDIDLIIRTLVLLAVLLEILLAVSFLVKPTSLLNTVEVAAVVVALVPQGLLVMVTVTYAMGAVRMSGTGALIQQANAVESMSHVTTLCMDKTGTLTTNNIALHALQPLGIAEAELRRLLGDFTASTAAGNRTAEAIAAACPGTARRVIEDVPFSSAYKWSALSFDDEAGSGTYVLGAPEMLRPALRADAPGGEEWTAQGLRVLLFAYRPEVVPLHGAPAPDAPTGTPATGAPVLPSDLIPLGLLSFSDELRPAAQETLGGFAQAGVRLKIISGDNPDTVAALARQAGFGPDLQAVSGLELAEMDDAAFAHAAEEATVFGRITPQQKEQLVRTLRARGHYVAMIGDGVNDVLSLKQAHLGIAMHSGSQATRSVADIVLLNDSFGVLPTAFQEGQRILRGMQDIMRLLLARTLFVTLLILGAAIVGVAFPLTPKHSSLLTFLTVAIPTLGLAAWARPGTPPRSMLRSVMHFVLPAAFTVAVVVFGVYMGYLLTGSSVAMARTAMSTTAVLCGLVLIPFVQPPTPGWVGGDELSGDWRPTILALVMLVTFALIMLVPGLRHFFALVPLRVTDILLIGGAVVVWGFALRYAWRTRLFERLLGYHAG